jgi:hypothetical protein
VGYLLNAVHVCTLMTCKSLMTGAASQTKLSSRFQGGEAHKMATDDNVATLHRLDTIFAKIKQVLPGLDLLTKKMVDKGDIDDVKLIQERGQGIPAKSGGSFMSMNTAAFAETLLERAKREFSRLEYEAVNSMMGDLQAEFRAYKRERKRNYRKKV